MAWRANLVNRRKTGKGARHPRPLAETYLKSAILGPTIPHIVGAFENVAAVDPLLVPLHRRLNSRVEATGNAIPGRRDFQRIAGIRPIQRPVVADVRVALEDVRLAEEGTTTIDDGIPIVAKARRQVVPVRGNVLGITGIDAVGRPVIAE